MKKKFMVKRIEEEIAEKVHFNWQSPIHKAKLEKKNHISLGKKHKKALSGCFCPKKTLMMK